MEVFADVWCPFAHVGLTRLVQRRTQLAAPPLLHVRAWPLELVNGEPLDADKVGEEIDALQATVAADLFQGFDRATWPTTTLPALRLAAAAHRRAPALGETVALDLRRRLFERGQDISAPEVLRVVADEHGVADEDATAIDAIEEDLTDGRARGVIGSPHFFTPSGDFFCPSLQIEHTDDGLHIEYEPDELERFLAACFA